MFLHIQQPRHSQFPHVFGGQAWHLRDLSIWPYLAWYLYWPDETSEVLTLVVLFIGGVSGGMPTGLHQVVLGFSMVIALDQSG